MCWKTAGWCCRTPAPTCWPTTRYARHTWAADGIGRCARRCLTPFGELAPKADINLWGYVTGRGWCRLGCQTRFVARWSGGHVVQFQGPMHAARCFMSRFSSCRAWPRFVASAAGLAVLLAGGAPVGAQTQAPEPVRAQARVTTLAKGPEHPWSLAFLPGGGMLITERAGRLRHWDAQAGLSQPLSGLPE